MSSRDKILSAVKANQPEPQPLPPDYNGPVNGAAPTPDAPALATPTSGNPDDLTPRFIQVLEAIGGAAYLVSGYDRIATILHEQFPRAQRILTNCPQLKAFAAEAFAGDPHTLDTVDLAILPAHFAVAENGACWLTEAQMLERALPFITQHLALVLPRTAIVATMHQAYDRIAALDSYGFATFIAGPSKTADIEQSLVLGAHGPRSLTVFLLDEHLSDAGFY
jgi:L-lactate dehydrogenase complex protein LldG